MKTIRLQKSETESVTPVLKQLNVELSKADALLDENQALIDHAPSNYAQQAERITDEFSLGIQSINGAALGNTNSQDSLMRQFDLAKNEIDLATERLSQELAAMVLLVQGKDEKKQ